MAGQGWAAAWRPRFCLCPSSESPYSGKARSPTYPLQIEDRGLGEPGKLVSDGPGGHRGEVGNE